MIMKYDIVILTDKRYINPVKTDNYINNVLLEDNLVKQALEKNGLKVFRTNWDNPDFDWTTTNSIIFRTTWDYFDRYTEFSAWLNKVSKQTQLINCEELIRWNIDKHYLQDLKNKGVNVVETHFVNKGETKSLQELIKKLDYNDFVLKPVVSGAARHTYKINNTQISKYEHIFKQLICNEDLMLQPYLHNITTKGEVAYMIFGGSYSHAILKQAKKGDFRVQDDFGGTIKTYTPSLDEIKFAENVVANVNPNPFYARVDVVWDNNNSLALAELELIEPELWFRKSEHAANKLANILVKYLTGKK